MQQAERIFVVCSVHGLQTHEVVKIIHQSMVMQLWKHTCMCTIGGAFVLCVLVVSLYDLKESVRVQGCAKEVMQLELFKVTCYTEFE